MKPTKLIIKNIGKITSETIDVNKPLILFYGEIKQGKTTILNSVRWVCGGEFPDDIIKHGEKEGEIELHFDGGLISRSFYKAKDGTTKARAVSFVKNGRPISSPVAEIKRLLNPFLLDQDFLRNKSELERKQYFTELFSVDTTALDNEAFNASRDASALRSKIAGYGEIDLTKVESVDVSDIRQKLADVRADYASKKAVLDLKLQKLGDDHQSALDFVNTANEKLRSQNSEYDRSFKAGEDLAKEIERIKSQLEEKTELLKANQDWLNNNPKRELKSLPAAPDRTEIQKEILELVPDTSALEQKIQDAGATNVRAEQYAKNKSRAEQKSADEEALSKLEQRQREIKTEKQAKLKFIGESCGIKGLEFDESGNFIYDGTTAGMISDSQIMRLSSELSALYPDGFGLDLIDRAESLGKSIFEFIDKAKSENKSILATIVGERPAKVPADCGVFVVEDGKLSKEELF